MAVNVPGNDLNLFMCLFVCNVIIDSLAMKKYRKVRGILSLLSDIRENSKVHSSAVFVGVGIEVLEYSRDTDFSIWWRVVSKKILVLCFFGVPGRILWRKISGMG